jgi:hypothetical protein
LEGRIRAGLSRSEGRRFGLVVGSAFLFIAAISLWRGHQIPPLILGGLGAALWLGGLLVPGHMGPVHSAWMAFAHALSKVTTPIFMSIVYLIVLTPTGLVMRLFGHRPLTAKVDEEHGGFWVDKDSAATGDLSRQF